MHLTFSEFQSLKGSQLCITSNVANKARAYMKFRAKWSDVNLKGNADTINWNVQKVKERECLRLVDSFNYMEVKQKEKRNSLDYINIWSYIILEFMF